MADTPQPPTPHYWLNENIQGIAAIIILIVGFSFLAWVNATETIKQGIKDLMFIVATFYFGGSRANSKRDDAISAMASQQANKADTVINAGEQGTVNVGDGKSTEGGKVSQ